MHKWCLFDAHAHLHLYVSLSMMSNDESSISHLFASYIIVHSTRIYVRMCVANSAWHALLLFPLLGQALTEEKLS